MPPPQEHVDQAFIPEKISRTEVCGLVFVISILPKDYVSKVTLMFEAFSPAFNMQRSRKSKDEGENAFVCERWLLSGICFHVAGSAL